LDLCRALVGVVQNDDDLAFSGESHMLDRAAKMLRFIVYESLQP